MHFSLWVCAESPGSSWRCQQDQPLVWAKTRGIPVSPPHQLLWGIPRCPAPSPKAPASSLPSLPRLWPRGSPCPISPPWATSPAAAQPLPLWLRLPEGPSGGPGPVHCQGIRVQLVILATHLHLSMWVQQVEPGSSPPWRRDNLHLTTTPSKGAMPSPQVSHSQ